MSMMRSTFLVGFLTIVSRLLGFLRECAMAAFIGSNALTDCFLVALRLANTCRRIFAEGAFNASFLPRFSAVFHEKGEKNATKLLSQVLSLLTLILSALVIAGVIFYPQLLKIIAPGFSVNEDKMTLSIHLGRILFPYILFISITALFCSVSNSMKKFGLSTLIFSFMNIFALAALIIGYMLKLPPIQITYILSEAILISGIVQVAVMAWYTKKLGLNYKFTRDIISPEVIDILKNMIPGIIGAGIWQINLLVDVNICSYLPSGTIACINLADRLTQFPLAIVGTSIGITLLPTLSEALTKKNRETFQKEFQNSLIFASIFLCFIVPYFICLAEPIVATMLQRGLFSYEEVHVTSIALQAFTVGLPAYIITKIVSSVFFAHGDTKTPVIYGGISVVCNIILIITLVPFGKYFSVALSTSLSAIIYASLLTKHAYKKYNIKFNSSFYKKLLICIFGAILLFLGLDTLATMTWYPELGESPIKWIYLISISAASLIGYITIEFVLYKISGEKLGRNFIKKR